VASGSEFDFSETTPFCTGASANARSDNKDETDDNNTFKLSVNKKDEFIDVNVYPIPTKELLYVDINKESSYLIIDMFGKIINIGKLDSGKNELRLIHYEVGVYFLRIINESNIITKKIIID
jgi:hypothetical protein